jgi:nucleoside-diphosphate-sugar epimerase
MSGAPRSSTVVVTGAAGFIGRAICAELAAVGQRVVAVGRTPPAAAVAGDWLTADVGCAEGVAKLPAADAIVHAAAVLPAAYSVSAAAAAENRRIDQAVFDHARSRGSRLVYLSGTAVYGLRTAPEAVDESGPLDPPGPYIEEKVWAEEWGTAQFAAAGLPFVVLRVSAPYGGGHGRRTVMNIFAENAVARRPLTYHGRGDREQDFVHVRDIGAAAACALTGPAGTYNVAAGEPVTMAALARELASAAGAPLSLVQPSGEPDPQAAVTARYSIAAAAAALGWRPQTALATGLRELVAALPPPRAERSP